MPKMHSFLTFVIQQETLLKLTFSQETVSKLFIYLFCSLEEQICISRYTKFDYKLCMAFIGFNLRESKCDTIKGGSHLSKNSISVFLHHCLTTSKCFILTQTPLQLNIRLQNYEEFDNTKNNIKQRNLNPVYANISKTTSPTSDSFLLIMSHIMVLSLKHGNQYLITAFKGDYLSSPRINPTNADTIVTTNPSYIFTRIFPPFFYPKK